MSSQFQRTDLQIKYLDSPAQGTEAGIPVLRICLVSIQPTNIFEHLLCAKHCAGFPGLRR